MVFNVNMGFTGLPYKRTAGSDKENEHAADGGGGAGAGAEKEKEYALFLGDTVAVNEQGPATLLTNVKKRFKDVTLFIRVTSHFLLPTHPSFGLPQPFFRPTIFLPTIFHLHHLSAHHFSCPPFFRPAIFRAHPFQTCHFSCPFHLQVSLHFLLPAWVVGSYRSRDLIWTILFFPLFICLPCLRDHDISTIVHSKYKCINF